MLAKMPLYTNDIITLFFLHVGLTLQIHRAQLRSELHDRHIYATSWACQAASHSRQVPLAFSCHTGSPACRTGFIGLPKGSGCEGNNGNVLKPIPQRSASPSLTADSACLEGDCPLHAGASAADSKRSLQTDLARQVWLQFLMPCKERDLLHVQSSGGEPPGDFLKHRFTSNSAEWHSLASAGLFCSSCASAFLRVRTQFTRVLCLKQQGSAKRHLQ